MNQYSIEVSGGKVIGDSVFFRTADAQLAVRKRAAMLRTATPTTASPTYVPNGVARASITALVSRMIFFRFDFSSG